MLYFSRMAHTKSAGHTKLGRDSIGKRLGIKKQDGDSVKKGEVVIRQRGTKYHPGEDIRRGKDDTLYAVKDGTIKFSTKSKTGFDGRRKKIKLVNVK